MIGTSRPRVHATTNATTTARANERAHFFMRACRVARAVVVGVGVGTSRASSIIIGPINQSINPSPQPLDQSIQCRCARVTNDARVARAYLVAAARVATDARGFFCSIASTRSIATRVVARAAVVVVAEEKDVPRANATGARARAIGTAPRLVVARRVTAPLAASGVVVVVVIIVGVANIVSSSVRLAERPRVRVERALDRASDR